MKKTFAATTVATALFTIATGAFAAPQPEPPRPAPSNTPPAQTAPQHPKEKMPPQKHFDKGKQHSDVPRKPAPLRKRPPKKFNKAHHNAPQPKEARR